MCSNWSMEYAFNELSKSCLSCAVTNNDHEKLQINIGCVLKLAGKACIHRRICYLQHPCHSKSKWRQMLVNFMCFFSRLKTGKTIFVWQNTNEGKNMCFWHWYFEQIKINADASAGIPLKNVLTQKAFKKDELTSPFWDTGSCKSSLLLLSTTKLPATCNTDKTSLHKNWSA